MISMSRRANRKSRNRQSHALTSTTRTSTYFTRIASFQIGFASPVCLLLFWSWGSPKWPALTPSWPLLPPPRRAARRRTPRPLARSTRPSSGTRRPPRRSPRPPPRSPRAAACSRARSGCASATATWRRRAGRSRRSRRPRWRTFFRPRSTRCGANWRGPPSPPRRARALLTAAGSADLSFAPFPAAKPPQLRAHARRP